MKLLGHLPSLLLLVLMILEEPNFTNACSCMPEHPQQHFCKADFVIKAKIKKMIPRGFETVYKVKVKETFKVTEKAKETLQSSMLYTASSDAMCGVHLRVGGLYLLTGNVGDGAKAHISLCGFQREWNTLSRRQRKGFRRIYGRGCDCKLPSYGFIGKHKDICGWNHANNSECYVNFGICLRSPSGTCYWTKSVELQRCLHHTPKSRDSRRKFGVDVSPADAQPTTTDTIFIGNEDVGEFDRKKQETYSDTDPSTRNRNFDKNMFGNIQNQVQGAGHDAQKPAAFDPIHEPQRIKQYIIPHKRFKSRADHAVTS